MNDIMLWIVLSLIALGILFSLIRLFMGPSIADRIVSLDTVNIIIIGLIVVMAVLFNNGLYLDIAIVYGILSFLETIVLSRYLEGKRYGISE